MSIDYPFKYNKYNKFQQYHLNRSLVFSFMLMNLRPRILPFLGQCVLSSKHGKKWHCFCSHFFSPILAFNNNIRCYVSNITCVCLPTVANKPKYFRISSFKDSAFILKCAQIQHTKNLGIRYEGRKDYTVSSRMFTMRW